MANDQGLGFTLSRRAQLNPNNTALIFREDRWTYAELNQLTNKLAHGLHGTVPLVIESGSLDSTTLASFSRCSPRQSSMPSSCRSISG